MPGFVQSRCWNPGFPVSSAGTLPWKLHAHPPIMKPDLFKENLPISNLICSKLFLSEVREQPEDTEIPKARSGTGHLALEPLPLVF